MKAFTLLLLVSMAVVLPSGWLRPTHAQQPVPPSLEADAVDRAYRHTVWMIEDGLPQNSINAIVQTRDAYLWLATFGGLVRFDGVTFKVFDVANADGLVSNRMTSLFEDSKGVLWIGHETGEITRYEDGVFRSYAGADGLQGGTVQALVEEEGETLWMGTRRGLVRFAEGVFTTYTTRDGLPGDEVFSLLIDRAGRLWIGTEGGLTRYEDGRFKSYFMEDGLPSLIVGELIEDREGRLWAGTSMGLVYYQDDRFVPFSPAEQPLWLIKGLEEDREGDLWVGKGDRSQLLRFAGATTPPNSPPAITARFPFDAQITTVFEDREGNLWVGTDGGGLHRLREKSVIRYTTDDGLPHNRVFRVIGDGEGGLWFNTACDNLTRYHDGTFTAYSTLPDGGKIGCVWSLLRDRSGVLWIGSNHNLIRLDEERYIRYTPEDGLPGDDVLSLFEDRDGDLWVGTGNNGLARFDGAGFTVYTPDDGLVHGDVRFITQSHDGAMWFGTREGLSRFQDGVFTNLTAEDGLSPGMVRALYEDADGTLWVGTYGGGLSRLNDGRITRYTMDDGLFDNVVSSILEDERGNLWMLGNLALFFVSRQALNDFAEGRRSTIESVSFGPDDGMAEGNGGGQPAGWQTDDGLMWFPTIDGLAVIDAKNFRINEAPPPVMIERVLFDENEVDLRRPVAVPPGKRDVEIHYAGLSFTAPEKVRFRFKLDGHDEGWYQAEDRRVAYFTNLAPGGYTFRVQAANNDGVWNETGASLSITLKPFFYETPWFYAVCMVLFGWAGYTAFRVRMRGIQARNIRLQDEIIERKRAEEALQESEYRFRSVFDQQFQFLVILSPEGRILEINDLPLRVQQARREDYVGKFFWQVPVWRELPEWQEIIKSQVMQAASMEEPLITEDIYLIADGTVRFADVAYNAIRDSDNNVRFISVQASDITERKQAEEALRASEERFSKAFQAAPVPMTLTSIEGGLCIDTNQALLDLFGFRRDEIVGKTMAELAFWDTLEDRARMVEMMRRQGFVREMEARFRTKSGAGRDVLLSVEFVKLSGQQCLLGVAQDVTERKLAAEEREVLIGELEARNAELERFTYTVSHDLKAPLVTIKGFLGLLENDAAAADTEQMNRDIARIGNAADKMGRLLGELLELSRIGRVMNPPEVVSLSDLAGEAASLVAGQIAERGAAVAIESAMPMVYGDRLRLLEVYQNLIDNAVKFMGDQAEPCIEVGARQEEGQVRCFVRDNGIGIEPTYHEKVFGLFDQLNPNGKGTGIGLALVRRILEVHSGRIWVESEGQRTGCTFWFSLPLQNSKAIEAEPE